MCVFSIGNSARIFFNNPTIVSKILGIPKYIIQDLGTIWKTLASGFPIDAEKFGNFCDKFVQKFQNDESVCWFFFSPTIHKILFHGKLAIEYFPGMSS